MYVTKTAAQKVPEAVRLAVLAAYDANGGRVDAAIQTAAIPEDWKTKSRKQAVIRRFFKHNGPNV